MTPILNLGDVPVCVQQDCDEPVVDEFHPTLQYCTYHMDEHVAEHDADLHNDMAWEDARG